MNAKRRPGHFVRLTTNPAAGLVPVTSWQEYATEEQARHVCQEWKNDHSWSARYFANLPAGEILDTDPEDEA